MHENNPPFKQPPKKYQPAGLTFLYEDQYILVVSKANGLLTVSTDNERQKTAYFLLDNYVKKGNARSHKRIFIVHRLDRETSGVLIFAKTEKAKKYLQEEWHNFTKVYYAVVHGHLKEKQGVITSYLAENKAYRMYSVKNPEKGKLSSTAYEVVKESKNFSLLKINLLTGRKNQIRVHLFEEGHPVAGDKSYGEDVNKGIKRLALHAASLTVTHPFTKEQMTFEVPPPVYLKTVMKH